MRKILLQSTMQTQGQFYECSPNGNFSQFHILTEMIFSVSDFMDILLFCYKAIRNDVPESTIKDACKNQLDCTK